MSYDLVVYLNRNAMPSHGAWRAAIVEAGFVALDSDFDVDKFSGFLPCSVRGEISGFDYYASNVAPGDVEEMELAPRVLTSQSSSVSAHARLSWCQPLPHLVSLLQ